MGVMYGLGAAYVERSLSADLEQPREGTRRKLACANFDARR
jgi:hypothetical protein